jgi:hypothetical protein
MKKIIVKFLAVVLVCAVSVISVHAEPKEVTESLTLAIKKANHALTSIEKEDYVQATESLNELEQLVTVIETNTPSREVEEILGEAEALIKKNELSVASAKLLDARKALKKLIWYKPTHQSRQLIGKAEKYLAKNKVSEALAKVELARLSARLAPLQKRMDHIKENARLARKYIGEGKKKDAVEHVEKLLAPLTRLEYLLPLTEARGYLGEAREVISKRDFDKGLALLRSAETKIALAHKSAKPTMRGYVKKAQRELEEAKKSVQLKEPRSVAIVYSVWAQLQNLMAQKACKL